MPAGRLVFFKVPINSIIVHLQNGETAEYRMALLFFHFLQESFDSYRTLKPADVVHVNKSSNEQNPEIFGKF